MFPSVLYQILPFAGDYVAYDWTHVITQLQLLIFSALAFTLLNLTGLYPPELRSVVLDFDWTYRRALPALVEHVERTGGRAWRGLLNAAGESLDAVHRGVQRITGPKGVFARTWSTGSLGRNTTQASTFKVSSSGRKSTPSFRASRTQLGSGQGCRRQVSPVGSISLRSGSVPM